MNEHPGRQFQEQTKHRRGRLGGYQLDWEAQPPTYKLYSDVPLFELPAIAGSDPDSPNTKSSTALPRDTGVFARLVAARRSQRGLTSRMLTMEDLSFLLWASTGITASDSYGSYRAAPSAGALYPVETYVVAHRVTGLPAGLYHYRHMSPPQHGSPRPIVTHALEQLRAADLSGPIAAAALDQGIASAAAAVFVWTAVFARSIWKYRERAFRYVYLDTGHIAAHVSLAAVALGLGSCPIAAFYDDELNALLGIDGMEESALYLTVVGAP